MNNSTTDATVSHVNKPRVRLSIVGGTYFKPAGPEIFINFPMSVNCVKTSMFAADRFKIVCSLYHDKDQSSDFWSGFRGIHVKIEIGFGVNPTWIEVFRGVVDKAEFDLIKGTITLVGRNYSALMIDQQLQRPYGDMKNEDVVREIAERHGLTPEWGAKGPPDGNAGTIVPNGDSGDKKQASPYNQGQYKTEWDLLAHIAKEKGRAIYVDGDKLFFVQTSDGTDAGDANTWNCLAPIPKFFDVAYQALGGGVTKLNPSNSIRLKAIHDFQFTQHEQTQVVIVHHMTHDGQATVTKFPPDEELIDGVPVKRHFGEWHNKESKDIDDLVKNTFNVMNFREWAIEWEVGGPEYLNAKVTDLVDVEGSDSAIDGYYVIDSIEYDLSFQRGFSQTIHAVWGKTIGGGANGGATP